MFGLTVAEIQLQQHSGTETWREYLSGNIWDYWLGFSCVHCERVREVNRWINKYQLGKSEGPNVWNIELTCPRFKLMCSFEGSQNWIHWEDFFYNFSYFFFLFSWQTFKMFMCINMETGLITIHLVIWQKKRRKSKKQGKKKTALGQKKLMFLFVIKKTKPIMLTELWPAGKTIAEKLLHFENYVFSKNTLQSILVILTWSNLAI